ncbi:MAG: hypothetical protein ABR499_11125 [Gemmatimonadaceae bacterium]
MTAPVIEGRRPAWDRGMQWKPVVAGALAGFAVMIILTTLGAALGISAADAADGGDGRAAGTGAGIWWILTALVSGLFGGWVIARTARRDLDYDPVIYGTLAWVIGTIILLFLLAIGVGSMMGGLGGGLGAAVAERGGAPRGSPADTARIAETAANIGKGAAWGLLLSQLLGLGGSIFAARMRTRPHREDATVTRARDVAA